MNEFLSELIEVIALDTEHLNAFLSEGEQQYLDQKIVSRVKFEDEFYTNEEGDNLETLLHFLTCHKSEIIQLLDDPSQSELRLNLYTSSIISANYNCFRFDLGKFKQTYVPTGEVKTIYRVGRENETKDSLGNSWSKSHSGVKSYSLSSSICAVSRPVFEAQINDSEILSEISSTEDEFILKKDFTVRSCRELSDKEKYGGPHCQDSKPTNLS